MLEKNPLYRRMQKQNIFRTFSRTYSRQQAYRASSNNHQQFNSEQFEQTGNSSISFRAFDQGRMVLTAG